MSKNQLDIAMTLASCAHTDQTDNAHMPYIAHICAVVAGAETIEQKTVAALHDIIEDTDITYDQLEELGFSQAIIDAIKAITKIKHEPYQDYLARVKANDLARAVKISDLKHNMDITRLPEITDYTKKRLEKYTHALAYLQEDPA